MSEIDELIDGVLDGDTLATAVEEHLDVHPLWIDELRVQRVSRRVHQRTSTSRSKPLWPLGLGILAAAAAAGFFVVRQSSSESYQTVPASDIVAAMDRAAPRRWTAGVHPLSDGELLLDADAVVWSSREDGADLLFVEAGSAVLPDGTRLEQNATWSSLDQPSSSERFRSLRIASLHRRSTEDSMLLHLVASLAATPDAFLASVEAAHDRLAACASTPCPDSEAAVATYVAAVGSYVDTGRVSKETSEALFALDPDLHAILVTTLPLGASAETVSNRRPLELQPIPPVVIPSVEFEQAPVRARLRRTLSIQVVDAEQRPIPTAVVVSRREYERHEVHRETGIWSDSVLYPPGGGEIVFEAERTYAFDVYAPGYQPQTVTLHAPKRKKTTTKRVQLTPFDSKSDTTAWIAHDQWAASAQSDVIAGRAFRSQTDALRQSAVLESRRWMRDGGGRKAEALCLVAGGYDACGLTPPSPPNVFDGVPSQVIEHVLDEAVRRGDFAHCSPRRGWVQATFAIRPGEQPQWMIASDSSLAHETGERCVLEQLGRLTFHWDGPSELASARVTIRVDASDAP